MKNLLRDRNLHLVLCVTLTSIMSVSSLIPVLPDIMRALAIEPHAVGWIITSFTLPGILSAPLAGMLADRLGRKAVLVPSLFVFGIAGAACFFAPDLQTFFGLRVIQGLGAGPLGVINATILADLYQGRDRATAMGYNASALSMGTALFPAIGGLLSLLGWRWPLLLPLLALPLGLAVASGLQTPALRTNESLGRYFRDAASLFARRQVLCLLGITFLTFVILYGAIATYLPILLHLRYGAEAVEIGLVVSASSLVTALTASRLGSLAARHGTVPLMRGAHMLYIAAMLLIPLTSGLYFTILPVAVFGLAQGLNIPSLLTMLSGMADMEHRAVLMAVNGMILRLAQTIAPLVMGLVYAGFGMTAVFTACALTAALMLAVSVGVLKAES